MDNKHEADFHLSLEPQAFPYERYTPLSCLGEGVSGAVYLCEDKKLNKNVAVKVLKTITAEEMVTFQKEAKTTARLVHQNIIQVLDFGATAHGVPFMVMQYHEGATLKSLIEKNGVLEAEEVLQIFSKVAEGLEYAHKNSIYHRDLQTSNILVRRMEGTALEVCILDFGLAKLKSQEQTLVDGRTIVGTPFYMSPDQAKGKIYDARSEVYSLACVMFEALTGAPPFTGATALETISMHAHKKPPSIVDKLGYESPLLQSLEEILHKCLAKEPDHRYQSMAELVRSIRDLHENDAESTRANEELAAGNEKSTRLFTLAMLTAVSLTLIVGAYFCWAVLNTKEEPVPPIRTANYSGLNSGGFPAQVGEQIDMSVNSGSYTMGGKPSDRDLENVGKQKSIRALKINSGDQLTGKGLLCILQLPNLKKLAIVRLRVPNSEAREFFKRLRNMDTILLPNYSELDDELLGLIVKNNPQLSELNISMAPKVTHHGLEKLKSLPALRGLHVLGMNLSLADIESLPRSLHSLSLSLNSSLDLVELIDCLVQFRFLGEISLFLTEVQMQQGSEILKAFRKKMPATEIKFFTLREVLDLKSDWTTR